MIQMQTKLEVADNSGAKLVKCVKVLGGSKRMTASLGDIIVVAVQQVLPGGKIKKGDVKKAVSELKAGKIEFRVEKEGIVHVGIGKISFDESQIVDNFNTFMDAIVKAKPNSLKGRYIKKISISSTMGPGIKIDESSIK